MGRIDCGSIDIAKTSPCFFYSYVFGVVLTGYILILIILYTCNFVSLTLVETMIRMKTSQGNRRGDGHCLQEYSPPVIKGKVIQLFIYLFVH